MKKFKFFSILLFLVMTLFFSNDFGLVNIEKTAIITAIGIDYENEEYSVTAQVAVPEATTSTTENKKAEITGKGKTVGSAIRNIGELSGWFPQLAFCNLIILGNNTLEQNMIKILDYFTKTLRVQDSAVVVLAEDKASDILYTSTPLDNVTSFAIQKILLKDLGFELGVATNDIKSFCIGYYSETGSSYMPIIKKINANEQNQKEDKSVFDCSSTALFLNGKKVGELNKDQTLTLNALFSNLKNSTIEITGVQKELFTKKANYMLTIMRCTPNIKQWVENDKIMVEFTINMYCKVSDQTSEYSDDAFNKNVPLSSAVKQSAESYLKENVRQLIETEKQTGCDLLKIKQRLYRFNNKYYSSVKDNLFEHLETIINVNVSGQK